MLHPLFKSIIEAHYPKLADKPVCEECGSTCNVSQHKRVHPFVEGWKNLCVLCINGRKLN